MCLVIREAESEKEKRELDKLLWKVLWEPLGFSPDIRKKFKLDDPRIELIAINSETKEIIGGLVANWISDETMEIRHIAVRPGCRNIRGEKTRG